MRDGTPPPGHTFQQNVMDYTLNYKTCHMFYTNEILALPAEEIHVSKAEEVHPLVTWINEEFNIFVYKWALLQSCFLCLHSTNLQQQVYFESKWKCFSSRTETQRFVDWCQWNNVDINAGKNIALVVDLRRCKHYSYTSKHLGNRLDWQHKCTIKERPEQTVSAEQTRVFWRAGGKHGDFLGLCGASRLLWSGRLGQQHFNGWQVET